MCFLFISSKYISQPSQVGVDLSSIGFETYIGDIMIAPVASKGGVILSPGSTSALSLVGRLIPQDSPAGLSVVSQVFNNFVQGRDSNVVVRGANAGPSDVGWLLSYEGKRLNDAILSGDLAQRRNQISSGRNHPSESGPL